MLRKLTIDNLDDLDFYFSQTELLLRKSIN